MSVNYASGLSFYKNKGTCGSKEVFDGERKLLKNVRILSRWIVQSKYCVLYCGAGISTAAGIPDFRGPNGIWTLEKRGIKPDESKMASFDQCIPTFAHKAIITMINKGIIKHVVSQNIDGLFLKANINRENISELHGNYFVDECQQCFSRFIRSRPSPTMGCRPTGDICSLCSGALHDTILDWEQDLPEEELQTAENESNRCDLAICLGTSLQIQPANQLPLKVLSKSQPVIELKTMENNTLPSSINDDLPLNKLVIINLQRTKFDRYAHLVIHHYIDRVMEMICQQLSIIVDSYDPLLDPTKFGPDLKPWNREKKLIAEDENKETL